MARRHRWTLFGVFVGGLCMWLALQLIARRAQNPVAAMPLITRLISASRLSDGDLTRLQRALAKARRGEPVTIGFIGGSITRGEQATAENRSYPCLVAQWWIDEFPKTQITLVNAGVSGTTSMYGCLREQRDLISKHPDFVVVEFGVNDPNPPQDLEPDPKGEKAQRAYEAKIHAQTYEGVIRQLLDDPDQPAIVELFMMHKDGTNAQDAQSAIGDHYQLPMISFRDAMWPEFQAGRLVREKFFGDTVHPNDRGHAAIAGFITSLLKQTLDHLPANATFPYVNPPLPEPVFSDLFEHTTLIDAANLHPVQNDGWSYDPAHNWWTANSFGSTIEFDLTGQSVDLLYQKQNGGTASAVVTVDGGKPFFPNTWLNNWGPLTQVDRVILGSRSEKHHVRIELLLGKNPLSGADEFRILGFGIAKRDG